MRILVTGANGFIAKNLISFLSEKKEIELLTYSKESKEEDLSDLISESDFIVHLAGVNRPKDKSEFTLVNTDLTEKIISFVKKTGKQIPILFSSSTQVEFDNDYGRSKKNAENAIINFSKDSNNPVYIFRLPNVFGKWTKPNYNSVVATFCYNITHNLPIQINDPVKELTLIYIDDVIQSFWDILQKRETTEVYIDIEP